MARHGIPSDKAFGVAMKDMKVLGKELGRNHDLPNRVAGKIEGSRQTELRLEHRGYRTLRGTGGNAALIAVSKVAAVYGLGRKAMTRAAAAPAALASVARPLAPMMRT